MTSVILSENLFSFYKKLLILLILALSVFSCAKEDNGDGTSSPRTANDEYYLRYELETSFIGRDRHMDVTVLNEKGETLEYNMRTGDDMEVVIGPVEIGFTALIEVNVPQYTARMHPKIFVSKNNGPFAFKVKNDVNDTSVKLSYTIDF
jgi:hypothetical protein